MFLLAVRSHALLQAENKGMFSSVLWSGGCIAWCVSPDSICSLPSTPSSILIMACPFCTHRLIKVECRDEVALPWSEGEPGRGESSYHQLPSPPAAQGMQGMSTSSVCSVVMLLQCSGAILVECWKTLSIKPQPFTTQFFFEELGCHWGNHSNGTGKVSCCSCFHICVASLYYFTFTGSTIVFPSWS